MALSRIWVYAEATEGKVAPITLEILAKSIFGPDTTTRMLPNFFPFT